MRKRVWGGGTVDKRVKKFLLRHTAAESMLMNQRAREDISDKRSIISQKEKQSLKELWYK